jgi:hypothetical protein
MKKTLIFLLLLGISTFVFAQNLVNEGFEGSFPPSGWTYSNTSQTTVNPHAGSYSVLFGTTGGYLYYSTTKLSKPGTLTWWAMGETIGQGRTIQSQYSFDGTTFYTLETYVVTGSYSQRTSDLSAYSDIFVRFYASVGNKKGYIDDVQITTRPPTIQPSSLNLQPTSPTSATITWTPGNGTYSVVFLREGTIGTPGNPVDGTIYTAGTWTNKGTQLGNTGYYCVYNGTGSSVDLTNLTSYGTYYAIVFTFNGPGDAARYLAGGNTGDGTLPVELSSFTAFITIQNFIMLEWVTQSETNVSGYYLFRNNANDLYSAERINAFVGATNTSQETSYVFTDREANAGYTYYYWLQHIEMSGESEFHGPVSVTLNATQNYQPIIPLVTQLKQVFPNPFHEKTIISYGIARKSAVSLVIVNVKGQVVRQLVEVNTVKNAGNYRVYWDGRNDRGEAVGSGVYFARMTAGTKVSAQKLILLK